MSVLPHDVCVRILMYLDNADLNNARLVSTKWRAAAEDERIWQTPVITCSAPVNIAVIKYWGKRDHDLILPMNDSLSGTLHQDQLKSTTSVIAMRKQATDELILNGRSGDVSNKRFHNVLSSCRALAQDLCDENGNVLVPKEAWHNYKVRIVSENNFPTAAGLASSASGFCCLAFTLSKLFGLKESLEHISMIARQGSGSACRSMFGGFSKWVMGEKADGSDSCALPVADENHWKEMHVLVMVVSDQKKEIGSTTGMKDSADLNTAAGQKLKHRCEHIVPKRMQEMEAAIANRDYETFARLSMVDSDDFHEICEITEPIPLHYMNDISRDVRSLVHKYNEARGKLSAAYTYDAGPNAVIYLLEPEVAPFLATVLKYFGPEEKTDAFLRDAALLETVKSTPVPEALQALEIEKRPDGGLQYILHTTLGPGPLVLPASESLI